MSALQKPLHDDASGKNLHKDISVRAISSRHCPHLILTIPKMPHLKRSLSTQLLRNRNHHVRHLLRAYPVTTSPQESPVQSTPPNKPPPPGPTDPQDDHKRRRDTCVIRTREQLLAVKVWSVNDYARYLKRCRERGRPEEQVDECSLVLDDDTDACHQA